jgi:hypothetical protein
MPQMKAKIDPMRVQIWLFLMLQAVLVFGLAIVVGAKIVPLGVPGEWVWERARDLPSTSGMIFAVLGVTVYAGLTALGVRFLAVKRSRLIVAGWLAGLSLAAAAVQVLVPMGAAPGYDLTKWATVNYLPGSSGYFQIARKEAAGDPWRFLAEYPRWIQAQDSLHIGTHPPGLIAVQCLLIQVMERSPKLALALLDHMPVTVEAGFRVFTQHDPQPLSRADRAALYATSLLTLLACAGTVMPLYLLARAALPAPAAWAAAAAWPLAPAANLFQPVADTAYPLLSTTALALAAWAARSQQGVDRPRVTGTSLAIASGIVMGVGVSFTMAFLPVGAIVALILLGNRSLTWRMRAALVLATGSGFVAVVVALALATGADPVEIARWNLWHHARFYDEFPRTYWLWLLVNPLELAIAIGLPTVVWCGAGLLTPRIVPLSVWSTMLVLALLNLTGRNMGEVARLWMLLMPPLLVAAGLGWSRLGARPAALAASVALLGAQTLALQAMIQVVYPV